MLVCVGQIWRQVDLCYCVWPCGLDWFGQLSVMHGFRLVSSLKQQSSYVQHFAYRLLDVIKMLNSTTKIKNNFPSKHEQTKQEKRSPSEKQEGSFSLYFTSFFRYLILFTLLMVFLFPMFLWPFFSSFSRIIVNQHICIFQDTLFQQIHEHLFKKCMNAFKISQIF